MMDSNCSCSEFLFFQYFLYHLIPSGEMIVPMKKKKKKKKNFINFSFFSCALNNTSAKKLKLDNRNCS